MSDHDNNICDLISNWTHMKRSDKGDPKSQRSQRNGAGASASSGTDDGAQFNSSHHRKKKEKVGVTLPENMNDLAQQQVRSVSSCISVLCRDIELAKRTASSKAQQPP